MYEISFPVLRAREQEYDAEREFSPAASSHDPLLYEQQQEHYLERPMPGDDTRSNNEWRVYTDGSTSW